VADSNLIGVVGGGLAGLAAAARLARAGHQVVVWEADAVIGAGIEAATEPGGEVLALPAAWRDLFRKSGRILEAELAGRGLRLTPAPPRHFRFGDGTELDWPTERGEQWETLVATGTPAEAVAWRDFVDGLGDVWQVMRRTGLEAEFIGQQDFDKDTRRILRPRRTLAQLAAALPSDRLGELVLDVAARLGQDPARLPGWHAYRIYVERTFGRWHLVDEQDRPRPASVLVDLIVERLHRRGVELLPGVEVIAIRREAGALVVRTSEGDARPARVISTVSPATHGLLTRDRVDLRLANRLRPAAVEGPLWEKWRTLLELPRLQPSLPGVLVASAWSVGGSDPWAQLLTGALATYRAHADLTGEDIRPVNDPRKRRAG
jgi:phytoene dehydrogenase-like protein